jgi:hypothetical protein
MSASVNTFIGGYFDRQPEYTNKRLRFKVKDLKDARACIERLKKKGNYCRAAWFNDLNKRECTKICILNTVI